MNKNKIKGTCLDHRCGKASLWSMQEMQRARRPHCPHCGGPLEFSKMGQDKIAIVRDAAKESRHQIYKKKMGR